MEFHEKLQTLRKEQGLTQEQLAEKLYVSRTAVSKWESGKGYPNIESLKSISAVFGVSIDDLLSGKELLSLAEQEKQENQDTTLSLLFSIFDLLALSFLFLPLFGQQEGDVIYTVGLFSIRDITHGIRIAFTVLPSLMAALGMVGLAVRYAANRNRMRVIMVLSFALQAVTILVYILTRQPYATSLLFLFFIVKIILWMKKDGNR